MSFIAVVLLSSLVIAQIEKPNIAELLQHKMPICDFTASGIKVADSIVVGGLVEDSEFPMPAALVLLKGTTIGTQTDFDRNFILTNPDFYSQLEGSLVCAYNGYEPLEIKIDANTKFVNGKFTEESYVILG